MSFLLLIAAAASTAAPSHRAHPTHHRAVAAPAKPTKPAIDPQAVIAAAMKIMDKLMPPGPAPDPARLAAARGTFDVMWPKGALGTMYMTLISGMIDHGLELHETDLAEITGKPSDPRVSTLTFRQMLTAKDGRFDQKLTTFRQILGKEIGKISDVIDPALREGMARSMARRFDARQIADVNAFLATPSGHAFGQQAMQLWMDPDVMRGMVAAMPELVKIGPDMAKDMQAAVMTMADDKATVAKPAPAK